MKPTKYTVRAYELSGGEIVVDLRFDPGNAMEGEGAEVYLASEVEPLLDELEKARARLANLETLDYFEVNEDGFINNTSDLAEIVEGWGPGKWRVSVLVEAEAAKS